MASADREPSAEGPIAAAEPFLQPWQFFLLGGMLAAPATVIVATTHTDPLAASRPSNRANPSRTPASGSANSSSSWSTTRATEPSSRQNLSQRTPVRLPLAWGCT